MHIQLLLSVGKSGPFTLSHATALACQLCRHLRHVLPGLLCHAGRSKKRNSRMLEIKLAPDGIVWSYD